MRGVILVLLVGGACSLAACDSAKPIAPLPSAAVHEPPLRPFVAPQAWRPTFGGGPAIQPPDLDAETWRAFVNQFEPIQRETPVWQDLPAREAVVLKMPEGSRHRCVVSPLEVAAQADDFGAKLEHWVLLRAVICSSDGFATWTSYPHRVAVEPDGSRRVLVQSSGLLQARDADGAIRESYVVMRSDKELRAASLGAPRILEGVEVAD